MDAAETLRARTRAVLEANYRPEWRYTAANRTKYPYAWLWDSCFHALLWLAVGEVERAREELVSVFHWQQPHGFVPHIGYQADPPAARALWRHDGHSSITQPPMYGHAVRVLHAAGVPLGDLAERARAGLWYLATHRRDPQSGLLEIFHPSESGAGNVPRWDSWADHPYQHDHWQAQKDLLARAVICDDYGAAVGNPAFRVRCVSFTALTAFNMRELVAVTGDREMAAVADELAAAVDAAWNPELSTWIDQADDARPSLRVRTLDALLGVLASADTSKRQMVYDLIRDPTAFGAQFGIAGVHQQEPTFQPDGYWRGAGWPHLNYLFWLAALRDGMLDVARDIAARAERAAWASNFSEYFDPLTGAGLGARPQCWACLPLCFQ